METKINEQALYLRCIVYHAIRRAYERYKIELREFDLFRMCDLCKQGKAKLKSKREDSIVYKVSFAGKNFLVVYDPVMEMIRTFLPHKAMRRMDQGGGHGFWCRQ